MAISYVNTKLLLTSYIRSMLGEPIIEVEVTDDQISSLIDTAVQKFTDFSMDGDSTKIYSFDLVPNINTYIMDDRVQAITTVRTRNNSFNYQMPGVMVITPSEICASAMSPMGAMDLGNMSAVLARMETLEKMFYFEPNWSYNGASKVLEFYDTTSSQTYNHVIIEAYVSYAPLDTDMIYNHQWVKEYSKALVKQLWGNNIGKYNATLINGSTLNYDRILTEAEADLLRLNEELLTRWSRPLGIYRA